jgi:hypothetical protein
LQCHNRLNRTTSGSVIKTLLQPLAERCRPMRK